MPNDDENNVLPEPMGDRIRPQANRTILGILLAVLFVAVLLALWFLIFDNDDGVASGAAQQRDLPTAVVIPTSTAGPLLQASPAPAPTPTPAVAPTPVPAGFEACPADREPITTTTYIVDTNTVPLNQRSAPDVTSDLAGTFAAGRADLVFAGDCLKNLTDGYVWWKIFNGTEDVWIASDFVTAN